MVRTLANFVWDVPIPEDGEPPFAETEVAALVQSLKSAGLDVSAPEDEQYAWGFSCRLPHLRMDCQLGLIDGELVRWLLACYPWRGWSDWWRGQWREDEQEQFVHVTDGVLRADKKVSDLVWLTQMEWDKAPRRKDGSPMGVSDDIIDERVYGVVRCGLSLRHSRTIPELAREFGLRDEPSCYKEIDEPAARRLIRFVLCRDLAYNCAVMSEGRAAELADRFLAQFGSGAWYFSNGNWHLSSVVRPHRVCNGASWDSVTAATFDTGVLAIGPECSGCLWIEDED